MDTVTVAIGIGLIVSLLMSEWFGLAAGGMVVPGYLALFLNKPWVVALTLAAALAAFLIIKALSSVMILYGKRRTALTILIGFLLAAMARAVMQAPAWNEAFDPKDFAVIGYIIPGLMAIWIERQGLLETFSASLTAGAVVRLALIVMGVGLAA